MLKYLPEMIQFVNYLSDNRKQKFYKHFATTKSIREVLLGTGGGAEGDEQELIFSKSKSFLRYLKTWNFIYY